MEQISGSPMLQMTLNKMSGDMNFVGIFYIIIGALYSISIVGLPFGIPMIISGLRLRESSDLFSAYITSGDSKMMENALERQSRFFFIQKVLMIITIVIFVLYIIILIAVGASIMSAFSGGRIS